MLGALDTPPTLHRPSRSPARVKTQPHARPPINTYRVGASLAAHWTRGGSRGRRRGSWGPRAGRGAGEPRGWTNRGGWGGTCGGVRERGSTRGTGRVAGRAGRAGDQGRVAARPPGDRAGQGGGRPPGGRRGRRRGAARRGGRSGAGRDDRADHLPR